MLDSNTAHDQQALLATHRRTLSYLLEKAKKYEGVALAPPEVRHGIDQARSEIERIKRALSEQSIEVADEEGDTPTAGEEGGAIGMVWKRTRVSLLVVVLLTGVFVATSFLSALTNIGPAREQLQSWGWWPLPFVPGQPGETLIVVMPFFLPQGGNDPDDAANEIFNHISQDVEKANLSNVRVELMEGRQFRAEDRAKAEAFGKSVGASIIVWGTNTGVKVQVNYLNLRQPDFDAADVIVKRLKEQAGEAQTQPANPTPYARYVTDDLPRMISFLSLFAVGQAAFVQDNYSQAAQIIEQGLATVQGVSQIDSQQAEAYFRLGWLREELGQIQQAISAYDRAIAINPNAPSSYNNRGILLKEQGDLVGTRADYDQAIALDSTFSEAYYNRAILRTESDSEGALRDYDQTIALNPKFADAYFNRAILRSKNDPENALKDFNQAIALSQSDANMYSLRGVLRQTQSDTKGARFDFDKAIELNPNDGIVYLNRGMLRQDQGDKNGARDDYTKARDVATNDNIRQTAELGIKQLDAK